MKRNIATFLLLLVALTGYGMFVVNAAPPAGGYDPGIILDPDCAPGDPNCFVKLIAHVEGGLAGTGTVADKIRLTFLFENDAKGIVSLGTGASSDSSHSNSIFIGLNSGTGSNNVSGSAFIGTNAGANSQANYSNFMGNNAGSGATNADDSNFFGFSAGYGATDANNSNFFGQNAGINASGAECSNFFGNYAGASATNAQFSNFVGYNAGANASGASYSNFFGYGAEENAIFETTNLIRCQKYQQL